LSHQNKNDDAENNEKTQLGVFKRDNEEKTQSTDPCLTQLSGLGSGKVFNLRDKVQVIGRDASCDIWVDDPHISRKHAIISNKNNITLLRDENSTNGVFINGKKIVEHELKDGDRILIGTRLYFKYSLEFADYQFVQNQKYREANLDTLTGLYNKRYFNDVISREFSFSRRNKNSFSLLMIDVDYFKKVNDSYGHLVGDHVLTQIGEVLKKGLRHENISCRYGGEEFAIILRNTGPIAAQNVAERIRSSIEKLQFEYANQPFSITVSIGIATYEHGNFETFEEVIRFADELLYESKLNGRNRVTLKKVA
jgi:two-component system, cell cycle response regulator